MQHPVVQPLLIELLTEELPPKALHTLGQAFAGGIRQVLEQQHLLAPQCVVTDFATPRRLAVHFDAVRAQAPDQEYTDKLMPAKIGLAADGQITPALAKRLAAKGLSHLNASELITESDGKQDYLFVKGVAPGAKLAPALQEAIDYALSHLPIPKVMHYSRPGADNLRFVRPAHGLVALFGADIVPVHALGLNSGRHTQGHRFMGQADIELPDASQYPELLREKGRVIASFEQRRALIAKQLEEQAMALNSTLGDSPETRDLLDEVTALVEYPTVYAGEFDPGFLRVPPECLILTMRLNQKYFPLFQPDTGALTHHFLIVSNMQVADPVNIIEGNERVVRPRLADAQFFFDTDRKAPLADRVEQLKGSVYHNRLGSQFDRMERVQACITHLAEQMGANVALCRRAARLAKADLTSGMVAEFPELQGVMGAYYAQADGENAAVVRALREQYRLRVSSAPDHDGLVSVLLFMADRLETLVGIWGIGLPPTGERDPFGLRRAALGIISAYEQLTAGGHLPATDASRLALTPLLEFAARQFAPGVLAENTATEVADYIYERYRNQLTVSHDRRVIDAVLALRPPLHQVPARIAACVQFASQPEAERLAAANKRMANLLRRTEGVPTEVNPALLQEAAEQALATQIDALRPVAEQQLAAGDFAGNMATLAQSSDAVDAFFDDVMVMADDTAIRANRLGLLQQLHDMMNQVADISRLAS